MEELLEDLNEIKNKGKLKNDKYVETDDTQIESKYIGKGYMVIE